MRTITKRVKIVIAVSTICLFFASAALADSGTVLKWENKSYSQSAHIIRNQVVYTVKVGDVMYQIARRSDKVDFTVGQNIECRPDKNHLFVANAKGKGVKYDIVRQEGQ